MTRREKVLAMCVGGTLGGLVMVMLVRWVVVSPFQAVKDEIAGEQARQQRLTKALRQLDRVEMDWQTLTARTFATDAKEAERRFREDMHQLLERHGLHDPKLSPGAPIKYKDGSMGVPLTINATGTLNKIVGFLCDFYRRGYLARLDKVRITADQNVISNINSPRARGGGVRQGRPHGGPAGRAAAEIGPEGPELKINISAVTLVLPQVGRIPHQVLAEVVEDPSGRLLRELGEYHYIFDKNLFLPYQPKAVAAPVTPTTTSAPVEPPKVVTPPPVVVDPRPGVDQLFVRGSTRLNGEETVYVYDEKQKADPPKLFHVDDAFDDGKLIMILPQGLVVRVEKAGTPRADYFYPLGKSFRDREDVTPETHPDIIRELEQEGLVLNPEQADGTAAVRP